MLPGSQAVRPVRDDVRRLRPLSTELLHRLSVHGKKGCYRRLSDEPRLRSCQRTLSVLSSTALTCTLSRYGEQSRFFGIAAVVLPRSGDPIELIGGSRRQLGVEDLLPGVLEVGGGHRIPVRPTAVPPQVEGDRLSVVAHFPALRQRRLRLELVVQLHERVHHVQDEVRRDDIGDKAGSSDGGSALTAIRSVELGRDSRSSSPLQAPANTIKVTAATTTRARSSRIAPPLQHRECPARILPVRAKSSLGQRLRTVRRPKSTVVNHRGLPYVACRPRSEASKASRGIADWQGEVVSRGSWTKPSGSHSQWLQR